MGAAPPRSRSWSWRAAWELVEGRPGRPAGWPERVSRMDLSLTTEQQDLQQSVRRFVRGEITLERLVAESQADVGFDAATWAKMAELGWLAMAIPEDLGGVGASLTDVAVLFEELGRGPAAGPLFESGV